jgi:hypothetical protein
MTRDEYEGRVADLKRRYRYLFAGDHIGQNIAPGWFPIFSELCARIDAALSEAEKPGVHFVQIKEKLGGLRCYLNFAPLRIDILGSSAAVSGYVANGDSPKLFERLAPLIHSAEEESYRTCLFCGAPGRLRRDGRTWILTLCERHANCTYLHLETAFAHVTDPNDDMKPPESDRVAAAFLSQRAYLRDQGLLHVGILAPVGEGLPYRFVLMRASEATLTYESIHAMAQLIEWPLDAIELDQLHFYPDRPTTSDVRWVF